MDRRYIIVALVLIYGVYDAIANSDYLNTSIVLLIVSAIFFGTKREAEGKGKTFRIVSIISILTAVVLYVLKIAKEANLN